MAKDWPGGPTKSASMALGIECATPVLVMDLQAIEAQMLKLSDALGDADIYYAVKSNPTPEVVRCLSLAGARMDVASIGEIEICQRMGIGPDAMSFGNTIKAPDDIRAANEIGVRRFSVDCREEVDKVATCAPGAEILVRIAAGDTGAGYCLGEKFGCPEDEALLLLLRARDLGLIPAGVSFHVGSQATRPQMWRDVVRRSVMVMARARANGCRAQVLNIGGGFPSAAPNAMDAGLLAHGVRNIVSEEIQSLEGPVEIMAEPGRGLVADAGAIAASVVLTTRRAGDRWVYLDVGRFSGLAETEAEFMQYPVVTRHGADVSCSPAIMAGPTCDSADVLWRENRPSIPDAIEIGDRVVLTHTGAYTASYSTVGFNGFAPLGVVCV